MAKTGDIIKQLMEVLPDYSEKFSDNFVISSVTEVSAGVFRIQTAANHGLKTGDYVQIRNVGVKNPITDRAASGGFITLTTQFDHDLTEGFHTTVALAGFTGLTAGNYALATVGGVPAKNKFKFPSGATITANGYLTEFRIDGINGRYQITVLSANQFTVANADCPFEEFVCSADSKVSTLPRISGMSSSDRIEKYYSEHGANKLWAFVVNGDCSVSYDRNSLSDAQQKKSRADQYFAECVHPFTVYVVAPSTSTISGRLVADEMIDIRAALCKTLCGVQFDSGFVEEKRFLTAFLGDGFFDYLGAYYVHRFSFETVYNMNPGDIVRPDDSRAFRRFEVDVKLQFDEYEEVKKEIHGDLPT